MTWQFIQSYIRDIRIWLRYVYFYFVVMCVTAIFFCFYLHLSQSVVNLSWMEIKVVPHFVCSLHCWYLGKMSPIKANLQFNYICWIWDCVFSCHPNISTSPTPTPNGCIHLQTQNETKIMLLRLLDSLIKFVSRFKIYFLRCSIKLYIMYISVY